MEKLEEMMKQDERLDYEKPMVEKVEFDFSDRIAMTGCSSDIMVGSGTDVCFEC